MADKRCLTPNGPIWKAPIQQHVNIELSNLENSSLTNSELVILQIY